MEPHGQTQKSRTATEAPAERVGRGRLASLEADISSLAHRERTAVRKRDWPAATRAAEHRATLQESRQLVLLGRLP